MGVGILRGTEKTLQETIASRTVPSHFHYLLSGISFVERATVRQMRTPLWFCD
jgi:hypothetical protein